MNSPLRGLKKSAARWVVFDEIGGPITHHMTQDEAYAVAKERGRGRTIVYVAHVMSTNDSEQWSRPVDREVRK